MSKRVGAGQVSRAGVCARGGLSTSGAGGTQERCRAGCRAAVGAGPSREGADAAWNRAALLACATVPRQESHSPGPGHATSPKTPAQGDSLSTAPSQRPPPQGPASSPCAPACPWWSSRLLGRGRGPVRQAPRCDCPSAPSLCLGGHPPGLRQAGSSHLSPLPLLAPGAQLRALQLPLKWQTKQFGWTVTPP